MNAPGQGFRLEELRIEPIAGEVSGPGGREKLDPKVMDVLVYMARHARQVVLREDLLRDLWPGVVVTDDALTRCFYELRRQLSRAGGNERYRDLIETLPKRGYRLNASVAPTEPRRDTLPQSESRRRWLAASIAIPILVLAIVAGYLLPRSSPKSIAVLPFVDMSAEQDHQYLSDGIAEEILDRLAKAANLRVIARTSSFSFRNRPVDIPEIAARLNVSHVLEGSVRRSGDRVRITVQLVEGEGASHVWSETYDRELGELFAVQDEIAAAVATSLQATLDPESAYAGEPANAKAYEAFLHAEHYYDRRAPGDIERAVKYYEQAISHDPRYARAWAGLSGAYGLMWWEVRLDPAVWRKRQGEAARKAVELDPKLLTARLRLAGYYLDVSDRRNAVAQFKAASALDPNDRSLARAAQQFESWHGTVKQNLEDERRKVERDPLSAVAHVNFGLQLFASGRLDEAKAEFQKALELSPGKSGDFDLEICRVLVAQRRFDEAYAEIMRLDASGSRDYGLALLNHAPQRRAESEAALDRLRTRTSGDFMHGIRLAEAYAFRGRIDDAFATLLQTRDGLERDESILTRLWYFQHELLTSPFLVELRSDARWKTLMAKPVGNTAEEIIEGLWPSPQMTG